MVKWTVGVGWGGALLVTAGGSDLSGEIVCHLLTTPPTPHDIIGMSVEFFEDPYNSDPIVTGLVCLSASCPH